MIFDALYHLHLRKRVHQKLEPYPHPNPFKQILDHLIYVVGVSGPILTIPQVLKIWESRSADGVSLITWGSLFVIACVWLLYGIVHREKPIIAANILWILVDATIVGSILYFS